MVLFFAFRLETIIFYRCLLDVTYPILFDPVVFFSPFCLHLLDYILIDRQMDRYRQIHRYYRIAYLLDLFNLDLTNFDLFIFHNLFVLFPCSYFNEMEIDDYIFNLDLTVYFSLYFSYWTMGYYQHYSSSSRASPISSSTRASKASQLVVGIIVSQQPPLTQHYY